MKEIRRFLENMDEDTLEFIVEFIADILKFLFILFIMYKCAKAMFEVPIEKKNEEMKQIWVKKDKTFYILCFETRGVKNESVEKNNNNVR